MAKKKASDESGCPEEIIPGMPEETEIGTSQPEFNPSADSLDAQRENTPGSADYDADAEYSDAAGLGKQPGEPVIPPEAAPPRRKAKRRRRRRSRRSGRAFSGSISTSLIGASPMKSARNGTPSTPLTAAAAP